MTRVTLPDDLAALAGCAEVDVTEDDLGLVEFRDGARVHRYVVLVVAIAVRTVCASARARVCECVGARHGGR